MAAPCTFLFFRSCDPVAARAVGRSQNGLPECLSDLDEVGDVIELYRPHLAPDELDQIRLDADQNE